MGFFDNLKRIFTVPSSSEASFITFRVKCNRCGEEIEVKARKASDVSRVYEDEGPKESTFFLRKEILGKKCNNLIYATIYFDQNFSQVSRDIAGGEFIE